MSQLLPSPTVSSVFFFSTIWNNKTMENDPIRPRIKCPSTKIKQGVHFRSSEIEWTGLQIVPSLTRFYPFSTQWLSLVSELEKNVSAEKDLASTKKSFNLEKKKIGQTLDNVYKAQKKILWDIKRLLTKRLCLSRRPQQHPF